MLFQIEEPDGAPGDAEGPGAAVGIDLARPHASVAIAIGGNAEVLPTRDGGPGPETAGLRDAVAGFATAPTAAALLALRGIAERALARPVTHAAVVVAAPLDATARASLAAAAAASGLVLTRVLAREEAAALAAGAPAADAALLGAAIAAEDDAIALRPRQD
ncbi:MAG TPA: hypothetical protein VFA50_05770 [Stellaceae bacterium]|nr:hypothetical protein [Stellaceae bacterium]